jgi:hypothetical protein
MTAHDQDYTRAAVAAMTRAVDEERDFAEWVAIALARVAAHAGGIDKLTAGRPGSWEAGHVDRLVRGTVGDDADLPQWAAPAHEGPEHHRPGMGAQLATLAVARAVLAGDSEQAAVATLAAPCTACLAIAAVQLGFTLAVVIAGEQHVTPALHRAFLTAIETAERELRAAPN